MTKEVEVSILGLQVGAGAEEDRTENVVCGEYFRKGDSHYLFYEETVEGFSQPFRSRIKCKGKVLELTRQGLVDTHMIFEENRKHMTNYATPFGSLLLGIDTGKVLVEEQEDTICIAVEYALEAEKKPLSRNRMEIRIRERR